MVAIIRVFQNAKPRVKFYEMTTLSDGFDLQRQTLEPEELLIGSQGSSMTQLAKGFEGF